MSKKFTNDWFSNNKELWLRILAPYRRVKLFNFLEIGCYEGMATCWLLDNFPNIAVDCVDTFKGSDEHGDFSKVKKTFLKNTQEYGGRLNLHETNSQTYLINNSKQYDIIYIDGSHTSADVLADAVLSFGWLKNGGLLIFDDYAWDRYSLPQMNPKLAIDSFLKCLAGKYDLIHMDYQVVIRRNV